jgi:hypothetical protein
MCRYCPKFSLLTIPRELCVGSAISAVKSFLLAPSLRLLSNRQPTLQKKGRPLEADDLLVSFVSNQLCSVAGAAGFALLIIELVPHAIAKFLHLVGEGPASLFAAGWRQQHSNSDSYANPD